MKGITSVGIIGGALTKTGFFTEGGACLFKIETEGIGADASLHLTPSEAAQWASVLTKYAEATK